MDRITKVAHNHSLIITVLNEASLLKNNSQLGLFFVSTAVFFWGILPIPLKLSGEFIDPVTLTWFRFFVAFLLTFLLQYFTGKTTEFSRLKYYDWIKLSLAALFSIGNYVTFVYSLDHLSPGQAQLNFQTSPFFLAFGGMLFFKEKLNPIQMTCFVSLALGLMLFFHPSLNTSQNSSADTWLGILIVQFSVISWTCYTLLQKSIVQGLSPNNILFFIYGFGVIALLPFCDLESFTVMDKNQWLISLFCAFNTLVAYGSFAQSIKYIPTTQVGSMVALTPIISFLSTFLVTELGWWPDLIKGDHFDILTFIGIALVALSVARIQLLPILITKRKITNSIPVEKSGATAEK